MDSTSFMGLLTHFETAKVVAYLQALDLQDVVHHPFFLGGTATLAVIALVMGWRLLLITVLSISGFAWLLSYTLTQNTSLEGGGGTDPLVIFVIGGAAVVFLAIYFLFVRGE